MSIKSEEQQYMQDELAAYRRLESLSLTDEFKEYTDMLHRTVAGMMITAFTTKSIQNWDEFCKVRGEIVARLQPLQAVGEAGAMAQHLENQIKEFYANNA